MPNEKDKESGGAKKKAAAAVALLTAAGVTAGSLFQSPSELLQPREDATPPPAYTDTLLPDENDDDDNGSDEQDEEKYRGKSWRISVKETILRLPVAVRLLVVLPLWLLGQVVLGAAGALWTAASPLIQHIAGFGALLLVLLATLLLAGKALFPNLPIKEILKKRSFLILGAGAAILGTTRLTMAFFWPEEAMARRLVTAGGSLLTLLAALIPPILQDHRERLTAEAEAPGVPGTLTFEDAGGTFTIRPGG